MKDNMKREVATIEITDSLGNIYTSNDIPDWLSVAISEWLNDTNEEE